MLQAVVYITDNNVSLGWHWVMKQSDTYDHIYIESQFNSFLLSLGRSFKFN